MTVADRVQKNRKQKLWLYGISAARHDALVQAFGSSCPICGRSTKLFIDHDHVTKNVRGLLCRECNTKLGIFDDREKLARIALYLANWLPQQVEADRLHVDTPFDR